MKFSIHWLLFLLIGHTVSAEVVNYQAGRKLFYEGSRAPMAQSLKLDLKFGKTWVCGGSRIVFNEENVAVPGSPSVFKYFLKGGQGLFNIIGQSNSRVSQAQAFRVLPDGNLIEVWLYDEIGMWSDVPTPRPGELLSLFIKYIYDSSFAIYR